MKSRLETIVDLAKRYDYDAAHSHQVECLAGTLFMELEPLHQLSREDRKLLEYAAILHDIGYYVSAKRHHKHALELIMIEPLSQFSRSEKLIIANIARYHRKAHPSPEHTPYAILTDKERQCVDLLSPLLRVADALDNSHKSVVQELSCVISEHKVTIKICVAASQVTDAEAQSVARRSDLFRLAYSRPCETEFYAPETVLEGVIA